jgi:hypothetical protein
LIARPSPSRRLRRLLPGLVALVLALGLPSVARADDAVQATVDGAVAAAAADDVQQSVAVLDRTDGTLLASAGGDTVYNSESILKLFTAAYYLVQADGQPDAGTAEALRTMIEVSDNGIQSDLWRRDIVPTIAERYGLTSTTNAANASSRNWGSGKITANDQVRFLWGMSQDPLVGPSLMGWMAAAAPTGSDGFDQAFGLNALTGDHGAKQGWSDSGWSPYNIHSVGWTGRFFVAILQTSYSAGSDTMKAASTFTAQVLEDRSDAMYPPAPAAPVLDCAPTGWLGSVLLRAVVPTVESTLEAVLPAAVDWCPAA